MWHVVLLQPVTSQTTVSTDLHNDGCAYLSDSKMTRQIDLYLNKKNQNIHPLVYYNRNDHYDDEKGLE